MFVEKQLSATSQFPPLCRMIELKFLPKIMQNENMYFLSLFARKRVSAMEAHIAVYRLYTSNSVKAAIIG